MSICGLSAEALEASKTSIKKTKESLRKLPKELSIIKSIITSWPNDCQPISKDSIDFAAIYEIFNSRIFKVDKEF